MLIQQLHIMRAPREMGDILIEIARGEVERDAVRAYRAQDVARFLLGLVKQRGQPLNLRSKILVYGNPFQLSMCLWQHRGVRSGHHSASVLLFILSRSPRPALVLQAGNARSLRWVSTRCAARSVCSVWPQRIEIAQKHRSRAARSRLLARRMAVSARNDMLPNQLVEEHGITRVSEQTHCPGANGDPSPLTHPCVGSSLAPLH
jgi:hypothetical protein